MTDVSNKTIVALLAVALVVSIAGTLYSVSELSEIGGTFTLLTGAQTTSDTGTGITNITLSANVDIDVTDATVYFGTGYVNASEASATIETDNTASSNWLNTSGVPFANINSYHVIENVGSTPVNLTVESDKDDAEDWLCGSATGCVGSTVADLDIYLAEEGNACYEAGGYGVVFQDTNDWSEGSSILEDDTKNTVTICDWFQTSTNDDELTAYFKAIVPIEVSSGHKTTTLTYTGYAR